MIRKIVGTAVLVSTKKIPIEIITNMLLKPELYYNTKLIPAISPNGLFLKKVIYNL